MRAATRGGSASRRRSLSPISSRAKASAAACARPAGSRRAAGGAPLPGPPAPRGGGRPGGRAGGGEGGGLAGLSDPEGRAEPGRAAPCPAPAVQPPDPLPAALQARRLDLGRRGAAHDLGGQRVQVLATEVADPVV